ncbi:MAG: glycosyltransferase family 61 protein, partial [Geitlerinemataceae cyanobacterium]
MMLNKKVESVTAQKCVLPSQALQIPQLTIFTYPTRLASAWKADILRIEIPSNVIQTPEIEIAVGSGTTRSTTFRFESFVKKAYRKVASPVSLSGQYIFDARQDTNSNMAHILKNMLPGLLDAQKTLEIADPLTAILPANASAMAKQVYEILGFSTLCTDRDISGTLISTPLGDKGKYLAYYDRLFKELNFNGYVTKTPERVFISRKGTRSLLNEKEIEAVLQDYGFQKVYYEDISVSEQWSISKNAKVVVGI